MATPFNIPATIIVGGGASNEVGAQAKRFGVKNVLLVTDSYMENSGLAGKVADSMKRADVNVTVFSGVQPDPTDLNVLEGLEMLKENHCGMVVGLGGGSPMDCAKAISAMSANQPPISRYAGLHKVPRKGVPIMTMPTTAGTGAEVTKVVVIGDTQRNVKMMILDLNLMPDAALVDYELTMSCPPSLTANVGVDTLVHAVEAYVSVKANPMTDPYALSSIRLVSENLLKAYKEPNSAKARRGMTLASLQAGIAFPNSSVCLVHGMSRPIGALYHVPHGLSNAVLFPTVTEFSISGAPQRYATVSRTMGYGTDADSDDDANMKLVAGLKKLNQDLQIPRLGDVCNVERTTFDENVQKMAHDSLASGSPNNNPVIPTAEQIVDLYHMAW
ncbi:MAG: iron-containing alcohol dehydrogenase [Candidatus Bathyarchaeota archaeon]|nr:iron-containing alcohol dehydrogenase [Candidatus Bathyarchaeota archaeon]